MREIIELEGRMYHSHHIISHRFGIDRKTVKNWVGKGFLPKPVRMGRHDYYDPCLSG